ncbi:Protein enhanced disease resistance 2 [Vitis vinifera]|uniref:Protein enhanced disease resistance 2 n=1 Tax=Vitis vinifera TaxID=29760 RepID=A0A438FWR3_VITVI|nr:Protein enhanced disease resistance 2 [Vitis vinifera]
MVYVLSIYNKKEKYHRITMAAFNIQEALLWKEKIESVIDQATEFRTDYVLMVFSIRTYKLLMEINIFHLNINLGWIMEGLLPHQTMKVSNIFSFLSLMLRSLESLHRCCLINMELSVKNNKFTREASLTNGL